MHFYPRSPCGERLVAIHYTDGALNFYPRSPCGERQLLYIISTPKSNFYPRSPCGERRILGRRLWHLEQFLSTLSLRRATRHQGVSLQRAAISIHALLAESDDIADKVRVKSIISIHALLAESDQPRSRKTGKPLPFLSTLSLRRATYPLRQLQSALCHFYPRSPCGERL